MDEHLIQVVPESHRDVARSALERAFERAAVTSLEPVTGGASGALTYRVDAEGLSWLLRIEGRRGPLRNPHQYTCLGIAAEAGIAPPVRVVDDEAGVVVMEYVGQRPLSTYPGGPTALARDLGSLVARLHATEPFPELHRFPDALRRMLDYLRTSGLFAEGVLDAHADGLRRVLEAYPWDAEPPVSSHNDPNPRNVLFDGERLWLVDWEAAYRSDPLVDVAIVAESFAPTPDAEAALVEAAVGRAADEPLRARMRLMRLLTRVYYAGLLLTFSRRAGTVAPEADLAALSPAEFGAAVARGELKPASPEAMWALGKMSLAGFIAGLRSPDVESALRVASAG